MSVPEHFERARRGDLRGYDQGAWTTAGRALFSLARNVAPPTLAEAGEDHDETARLLALRAALNLEANALCEITSALTPNTLRHAFASALIEVLAGNVDATRAHADTLSTEGARQKDPSAVIDGSTFAALSALIAGEHASALKLARRASRMAQAEHLWVSHLFASLVLARARRVSNQPHLAARIAAACKNMTPQVWHGWLNWEISFAGALEVPLPSSADTPMQQASLALDHFLRNDKDPTSLTSLVHASALHREDVELAIAARGHRGLEQLVPWATGVSDAPPSALVGLASARFGAGEEPLTPVVHATPERARRVLGFPDAATPLPPAGAHPTRTDTIIAALALAGPDGLERAALFELVYGFPFRAEIHEPTFRVLRHHAKNHIAEHAALERVDDRFVLRVHHAFRILDPRCRQSLSDRMLRYLGAVGRANAKSVAEQLGVPLRSVQRALKEMVEDGACAADKHGRRTDYVVSDTTFCSITVA